MHIVSITVASHHPRDNKHSVKRMERFILNIFDIRGPKKFVSCIFTTETQHMLLLHDASTTRVVFEI